MPGGHREPALGRIRWVFHWQRTSSKSCWSTPMKQKRRHSTSMTQPGCKAPKSIRFSNSSIHHWLRWRRKKRPPGLDALVSGRSAVPVTRCAACDKRLDGSNGDIFSATIAADTSRVTTSTCNCLCIVCSNEAWMVVRVWGSQPHNLTREAVYTSA